MKVVLDLSTALLDINDDPIREEIPSSKPGDPAQIRELTPLDFVIRAFSTRLPGDEALSLVDAVNLGNIAFSIKKGLPIYDKDITTIKERLRGVFVTPMLVFLLDKAIDEAFKKAMASDKGTEK